MWLAGRSEHHKKHCPERLYFPVGKQNAQEVFTFMEWLSFTAIDLSFETRSVRWEDCSPALNAKWYPIYTELNRSISVQRDSRIYATREGISAQKAEQFKVSIWLWPSWDKLYEARKKKYWSTIWFRQAELVTKFAVEKTILQVEALWRDLCSSSSSVTTV